VKYVDYVRTETGTILSLSHTEAMAYCKERGGRLPTMAEAYWYRATDPEGVNISEWTELTSGEYNVRGGSWNIDPVFVRVSYQFRSEPSFRNFNIGFRCIPSDPH
jgi:formylglycine-generating enzyme required for sulfatase activity